MCHAKRHEMNMQYACDPFENIHRNIATRKYLSRSLLAYSTNFFFIVPFHSQFLRSIFVLNKRFFFKLHALFNYFCRAFIWMVRCLFLARILPVWTFTVCDASDSVEMTCLWQSLNSLQTKKLFVFSFIFDYFMAWMSENCFSIDWYVINSNQKWKIHFRCSYKLIFFLFLNSLMKIVYSFDMQSIDDGDIGRM